MGSLLSEPGLGILGVNFKGIGIVMDWKEFIQRRILVEYVWGKTTSIVNGELGLLQDIIPEMKVEIEELYEHKMMGSSYEEMLRGADDKEMIYALDNTIQPEPETKVSVMARIDAIQKYKEKPTSVITPLSKDSKIEEFADWISYIGPAPEKFISPYFKVISRSETMITMIVWLTDTLSEIHHDGYERFLILEGNCDIVIKDYGIYSLKRGDYLEIPLHKHHDVIITSSIPCKAILQKIAA